MWLVWGPPGTGKTRLLQAAIGDLLAAGKRILLVSSTNIAVDNALLGVLRDRRHRPGQIIRVGPPQLRRVAEDPDVSLPLIVRTRLAKVEEQRRAVAEELMRLREDEERLNHLMARLDGFDPAAYRERDCPAAYPRALPRGARRRPRQVRTRRRGGCNGRRGSQTAAGGGRGEAAEARPWRREWARVEELRREVAELEEAAARADERAFLAEDGCARLDRA